MSVLQNQTSLNGKEFFFLTANISSLKVKSLEANNIVSKTLLVDQGTISSLNNNVLNTNTISAGTAQVNFLSTFYIDTSVISTLDVESDYAFVSSLEVLAGNISSIVTNNITLDGNTLDTGGSGFGSVLLLNGLPIATGSSTLSSIQDWSFFPAVSTIFMGGNNISNAGNITCQNIYNSLNVQTDTLNVLTAATAPAATITNLRTTNLSSVQAVTSNLVVSQLAQIQTLSTAIGRFSTLAGSVAQFSTVQALSGTFSNLNISTANISSISGGGSASNWYLYPAQSTVSFAQLLPGTPTPIYSLVGACNITCANLTAQLSGFPVPSYGGTITGLLVQGLVGDFTSVQGEDATFSNTTQTTNVDIYGVNRPAGFNALYVNGGMTVDAGQFVHGITLGTNTFGVSFNRIDILPIGTQSHITWGAMAHIAGLGMTLDAGLGINIAAGLVVDVLGQDVQLRANDDITLDADDNINLITDGTINMTANTLTQTANNFTFNDSNFTVNSSNINSFNSQTLTQGTPLPPSTIGFYSTFQQNSEIENSPLGAFLTAQRIFGLFQNISTVSWVVTSNISTIYTPSTTGILSSYTSTITSSFERQYSTISFLQRFPTGEVNLTPSSLLLQHADLIELDTKPFPIFTTLSPGQSTIVSSLYTYEAITDGTKYSEVGQIIQAIVPKVQTFSTLSLSTGVSSGIVLSTLTSSFYSTLISQTTFTSSIYNLMNFDSNCFSTPSLCISSINDFAKFGEKSIRVQGDVAQIQLSNTAGQQGSLNLLMRQNYAELQSFNSNFTSPLNMIFTADNFGFNVDSITGGIEMDISGNTQIRGDLTVTNMTDSSVLTPYDLSVSSITGLQTINGKDIYTFGEFLTTSNVTVTNSNTPTVIPFDTNTVGNQVALSSGAIQVAQQGLYKYNVSIQLDKSGGGTSFCDFWVRVNGNDIANTGSQITVQGNTGETLANCFYYLTLNANDTVESVFASDDNTMTATYFPAWVTPGDPYDRPAIPAVIASIELLR